MIKGISPEVFNISRGLLDLGEDQTGYRQDNLYKSHNINTDP